MKLIDEAIDLLGNSDAPLANAFMKAQIIAHKLQDKEFARWVRNEIQGYGDDDEIPAYRISGFVPHGNLNNSAWRYDDFQLPIGGMSEEMGEEHLKTHFSQSIAVIEGFAKEGKDLKVVINRALYPFLRQGIDRSYSITSAWGALPAGLFTQILNEARSRLLDLLLNLSDQIPETVNTDASDMPKIDGLNDLFKGAVFGSGANINFAVGSGNNASSSSVVRNDVDSLVRELTRHNVPAVDVSSLQAAIEGDATSVPSGSTDYGPLVRSWLGEMIGKAGTTAWEIPTHVAVGVLTTALSHFYGF